LAMKTNKAKDFYLKICIWTFLCLIPAAACHQLNVAFVKNNLTDNELYALQSIKTISELQMQSASQHQGKFAADFDELVKSVALDDKFTGQNPVVGGYVYSLQVENLSANEPASFYITADPLVSNSFFQTAQKHFYYDSAIGSIRATEDD
jgi:hypothetical protein